MTYYKAPPPSHMRLFVYGTHKPGFADNSLLGSSVESPRKATLSYAKMYDVGKHPAIRLEQEKHNKVYGVLYDIVGTGMLLLRQLDAHQGCPTLNGVLAWVNTYDRKEVIVEDGEDLVLAFVYYGTETQLFDAGKVIEDGVWR